MIKLKSDRILVVDDPCFDRHVDVRPHPERPERLDAARDGLRVALGPRGGQRLDAPWAAEEDLVRVHSAAYLQRLEEALASGAGRVDADTYFSAATREAVRRAAGGGVAAVDALTRGKADSAFLLLRPPGHHATADQAMGFCLLNHVAVAAASALAGGAARVAIVDWDVHHGNGTQAIFDRDPRVLFVSLHQWPLYPGTGRWDDVGRGDGRGFSVNVALPPGSDGAAHAHAFRTIVLPRLRRFAPDLILVSAGFDAHQRDPLAQLELDTDTYGAMAGSLLDLGVPTAFFLEGGYDLVALEESVAAVGRALLGERIALPEDRPRDIERDAVARTAAADPIVGGPDDGG